jgi:hypothetical protein
VVRRPRRKPYQPPPSFEPHSGPENPGFGEWDDVTPPVWSDEETPRGRMPRVLATKFESSSTEAEIFIHDPISSLTRAGVTDLPTGGYITTQVINHHRRLDKRIIRVIAVVDEESIGLTVHKEDA